MTSKWTPVRGLFTRQGVEEVQAILYKGGSYQQVPVYRRGLRLFAKRGGGYIALKKEGKTSLPDWTWDELDGVKFTFDTMGFLLMAEEVTDVPT